MKKKFILFSFFTSIFTYSQVGVNTQNPQGVFNVDGGKNNPTTGTPTSEQQKDDFIILEDGTVGIGTMPNDYAMLDVSSENKGFLAPRLILKSNTMDLNSDDDNDISNQPKGLLVYNAGGNLSEGYYYWNGIEWMVFDNSTAIPPVIDNMICGGATLSPAGYRIGIPYTGNLKIPYTGGNGGSYQSGASITAHGLTFILRAGKLDYGNGELNFSVSGTPDIETDFKITLTEAEIPFLAPGQGCTLTITNQTTADIRNVAYVENLKTTNDHGANGYHVVATTPDGKWSVRVFVRNNSSYESANLQLRYNGSDSDPATKDIISNASYFWGGVGTGVNNQIRHPKNVWAGYNGNNALLVHAIAQAPNNNPSWYDPAVYQGGMPEFRFYHWSDREPTSKVFYTMEFMMGSTNPTGRANATSCPSGICPETKVFFNIRQITAP